MYVIYIDMYVYLPLAIFLMLWQMRTHFILSLLSLVSAHNKSSITTIMMAYKICISVSICRTFPQDYLPGASHFHIDCKLLA